MTYILADEVIEEIIDDYDNDDEDEDQLQDEIRSENFKDQKNVITKLTTVGVDPALLTSRAYYRSTEVAIHDRQIADIELRIRRLREDLRRLKSLTNREAEDAEILP